MEDRVMVSVVTSRGSFQLNTDTRGLESWPEWFDGFAVSHTWDEEAGIYRGAVPGGVETITLTVRFHGGNVSEQVGMLLGILGEPGQQVTIPVVQPNGARFVSARFVSPGTIKWYPRPYSAVYAEVPLQFEGANLEWVSVSPRRVELTAAELGKVLLPYSGVRAAWPKITVEGSHDGVSVNLREEDESPAIPAHSAGLVIETDPAKRGVIQADTGRLHPGAGAAFWPEPPELTARGMPIYIDVEAPGSAFKVIVEYQERWSRAW